MIDRIMQIELLQEKLACRDKEIERMRAENEELKVQTVQIIARTVVAEDSTWLDGMERMQAEYEKAKCGHPDRLDDIPMRAALKAIHDLRQDAELKGDK